MAGEAVATKFGAALLMASTIPNNYTGVLPSGMTIRRFAADDEDRAELHRAMIQGTILSAVEIAGGAIIFRSLFVALAGLGVMAFYLHYYFTAIANPHPDVTPINAQES